MILLALVLGGAALAYTLMPLVAPGKEPLPEPEDDPREQLASRRRAIFDSIRDLEFELDMGKLTSADYAEVRAGLVEDAASVLESIDLAAGSQPVDQWIEAEVAARRQQGGEQATASCATCGAVNPPDKRYCDACGGTLSPCGSCGLALRPNARFCGECGAKR